MNFLYKNQRKDIPNIGNYGRIKHRQIMRLAKHSNNQNLFGTECVLYIGEIKKGNNPLFSFKGNKVSLYRLLYHNYIGDINKSLILKMKCCNYGRCCNVTHLRVHIPHSQLPTSDSDSH